MHSYEKHWSTKSSEHTAYDVNLRGQFSLLLGLAASVAMLSFGGRLDPLPILPELKRLHDIARVLCRHFPPKRARDGRRINTHAQR